MLETCIATKVTALIDVAMGEWPAERVVNLGRFGLVRKYTGEPKIYPRLSDLGQGFKILPYN